MLDEATAYSRLDSAVYGSLIHALEVTGACLRADVAAGRIYDTPDHAVNVHVSAHGLGLSAAQHADFNTWPNDKGSIFDYAAQGLFGDRIFRIDEMPNVSRVSRQRFFAKLANHTTIQDALCVSFSVAQSTWGAFVFIRCGSSLPFDNTHLDTLKRFRPLLARLVLMGYQKEISLQGQSPNVHVQGRIRELSVTELFAKLSRTERQIFDHLRLDHTERQIADITDRSPNTVHVHVKNIYRKLNVSSRKQLVELFADQ